MKYCVIVPDGAADHPLLRLGGKTPIEAANTPNMDRAAREGMLGVTTHVPPRMTPGSAVALMSVAGYNPREYYTGRGPLEAADMGIEMKLRDWAVRCNFVTVQDGVLVDFTADHISTEDAAQLVEALNKELGSDEITFHTGTGYRHVMIYRGAEPLVTETVPPHDIVDMPVSDALPSGSGGRVLRELMEQSQAVLADHPVTRARTDQGKNPPNTIWLWGQGTRPRLPSFESRFGLRGAVISAVKLARGIGRLIGWDVIDVPGATGYLDTDYAAKGRYAVQALEDHDLVLVHIEASDEASHERSARRKMQALERIDQDIVGPILAQSERPEGLRVLIMPDHITSVREGRHERGLVPFALWGEGIRIASGVPYGEATAEATDVRIDGGHELMGQLVHGA